MVKNMKRRKSNRVMVGDVPIGDDSPVTVQSMIKRPPGEVDTIIKDIYLLASRGCDIIRMSVPDEDAVDGLRAVIRESPIPVVADVHFHPKLALMSIEAGAHKLRLNPGNIRDPGDIAAIAREASAAGIPIRVGVNSGSVPADLMEKFGDDRISAMVEGAERHVNILNDAGFTDIVIALKSSHVDEMIEANRRYAAKHPEPLHLGVTESGTRFPGAIRSSIGIGLLLAEGIGDTIRVSLADDPSWEVRCGLEILRALGLRKKGLRVIACPTCGRVEIDVHKLAVKVEDYVADREGDLDIAVMGCVVNGPGEASAADIGICGGKGRGVIIVKGKQVEVASEGELFERFVKELDILLRNSPT